MTFVLRRLCVQLSQTQIAAIEAVASQVGVNRSEALRRALDQGLRGEALNAAYPHVSGQITTVPR